MPKAFKQANQLFALAGMVGLAGLSNPAYSACDSTADPVALAASCDDLTISTTKSDVTIGPSATVSSFFSLDAALIQNTGQVTGTFSNQGLISSGFGHNGFVNSGQVATFLNTGVIRSTSAGTSDGAIVNNNLIGTLVNRGSVEATVGTWGAGAHALLVGGEIVTLNNSGTISAQNSAIYFTPGFTARIGTLINSGTIQGGINGGPSSTFASAIELGSGNSIGTIVNTGTIDHSVCDAGGTCYAAIYNGGGSIGTITNKGTLTPGNTGSNAYGIINTITGTIGTLNNAQGDLKYFGQLPTQYNTIVNSTSAYGKLFVTSATSQLVYAVASGSTLLSGTTYAAVLNGVNASHLTNTTGTYGGGLVATTWRLNNSAGTQWDLITDAPVTVAPNTGSSSGNKLGQAITFAYASAVTASTPAAVTNGTSLVAAIQSLTPSQATSLTQVHAEGYSSNMTITLEQMGHVTNTVMDRVGAPSSTSAGASTSLELEHGRTFWIDASHVNGSVTHYDKLAGFKYRLSNLIMGRDIYQDTSARLGVLGGIGYTAMSEPEQVRQDFSSTNYYVGLYGAQSFTNNLKISAAAGYVYSDTSARRYNPDVGHFTGGTAQSQYQSNGGYAALKVSRPYQATEQFTVTPFVGVAFTKLWMRQTHESGGNDFNYAISPASGQSALTFAGAEFLMPIHQATARPLSLTGFYRLGYDWSADKASAHEITAQSQLFGSFQQTGANKGPVNHLMGLGLQGDFARGITIRAGIVGRISTHGKELGGGAEVKWAL